MAVSSGSYTIKTSGGDYSTWAAACDDIANLTGDLTFTADASAFTESTAPGALSETLGGYTLKFTAATFPTTTDATTGPRFTCNYTGMFFDNGLEGPGTVTVEGIVAMEGTSVPSYIFRTVFVDTGHTFNLRRCIAKGGGPTHSVYYNDVDMTFNCYNNILISSANNGHMISVYSNLTGHVSNNTINDAGNAGRALYINGELTGTFENNLAYNDFAYADFTNIGSATGRNNTTYDSSCADVNWGTGANNRPSKTADPFVDEPNDDYRLAAASDPIGNGKDLSAKFTTDFFGDTRSSWDIGAVRYSAAGTTVEPATLELALTQEVSTVVFPLQTVLPDTFQLALTLETPAITAGIVIVPTTFALALTQHAPGFSLGHTVSIGAPLALALTLQVPTVTFPLQTVLPDPFFLALAQETPVIITGDVCIVLVDSALELELAVEAPTILKNTLSWSAGLLTYKGITYEISAGVTQKRFVYWDPNYTTVFRTTDVLQDVFDADGWVMCLNESGVAYPAFARKLIHGGIIQAGTITAEYGQIAALTVGGPELKDSAVSEGKLAALSVSSAKIQDLTVDSAKITDLAVTTVKIGNLNVTTPKIADNAVTVLASNYTEGQIVVAITDTTIQTVTFTSTGEAVSIHVSALLDDSSSSGNIEVKLVESAVEVYSEIVLSVSNSVPVPLSFTIEDTPGAGEITYDLVCRGVGGARRAARRSMMIREVLK